MVRLGSLVTLVLLLAFNVAYGNLGTPTVVRLNVSYNNYSVDSDSVDSDESWDNSFAADAAPRHHHRHHGGGGFAQFRPATGRRVFIFNPNILSWGVYDSNGELIRTGHGVGGKSYCPDVHRRCKTPIGVFRVYGKEGPHFVSSKFPVGRGGAPMPWAMFFHGGFAIHGSNEVPNYNASHGCIRLYPADARWLNQNVLNYGSTVIVYPY